MQSSLPTVIQPWTLADEGAALVGKLPLSALTRLSAMLGDTDAEVSVQLTLGVDDQGVAHIGGLLETTVTATCQRCMEPISLPLKVNPRLGLVRDEAGATKLAEGYEPLVVSGHEASLVEIVEDELILALPFSPRCADPAVCERAPAMPGTPAVASNNPFAALSVLLSESKSKE